MIHVQMLGIFPVRQFTDSYPAQMEAYEKLGWQVNRTTTATSYHQRQCVHLEQLGCKVLWCRVQSRSQKEAIFSLLFFDDHGFPLKETPKAYRIWQAQLMPLIHLLTH